MDWKGLFKKIGLVAESVAVATVPGAAAVDQSVHAIVNAKTVTERESAIVDAALAGLDEAEMINPDLVKDPAKFRDAVVNLHKYAHQLKDSI